MILNVTWWGEVNQRRLKKKQHWRENSRKAHISEDGRGQQQRAATSWY